MFSRPLPIRLMRAGAIACLTAIGIVTVALPAGAHVTVSADDSSKGADDSILTFRVPNELDSATSMKLDVKFPTATPLAEVAPQPKAGYTITTKMVTFNPPLVTDDGTIKSGVGEVTWTADSAADGIPVGDFSAFQVLVGPLPDKADQLVFPAVQTYSNGQVVSWVEPTTDPGNPPEHPAAILALTAGDDDAATTATPAPSTTTSSTSASSTPASSGSASSGSASSNATATPEASASTGAAAGSAPTVSVAPAPNLSGYATTSDAKTGKTLGIIGIIVGALGLLVGAGGLARGRSRTGGAS